MNSRGIIFSIVAVVATIALFASGALVASHQAQAYYGHGYYGHGYYGFHHHVFHPFFHHRFFFHHRYY